jgi:ubiquinone biosynthesis protein UbiJ
MPSRLLLLPLNHLLSRADWARAKLQAHVDQTCRIAAPLLPTLHLRVDEAGYFTLVSEAPADAGTEVRIDLPADLLPRLFSDGPGAALAAAHLSGPAAFAETLGFVFRNLRWDIADDLAPWIGDVAAQRVATTATAIVDAKREVLRRLTDNATEFLTEEDNAYLPLRSEVDALREQLGKLGSNLDSLTQRITRLEG